MSTLEIRFTKMSGSGNDFLVIDNRAGAVRDDEAGALTTRLSRHRLSVGADGIVLISRPNPGASDIAYRWRYINADGSDGEMCGNGAMCAARFAVRNGIAPAHHCFETPSGIVEAWASADATDTAIAIATPGPVEPESTIDVEDRMLTCTRIIVGVPHVVIQTADADAFADAETFARLGRAIRLHPAFAPAGTNVNVVSPQTNGAWRMRTYERGVEAETLACGTGAVASAIVLASRNLASSPVEIKTSGSGSLRIEFELNGTQATRVRLHGQAAVIYEGVLGPDA
jgi:diaminopimelate epimerase